MEIEFIEHPPEDVPTDSPSESVGAARRPRARWLDLVPAPLFVAAAALAVVAPFERFYVIALTTGGFRQTLTYDGWGRLTVSSSIDAFGQHAARYGAVVVVLAGASVLVAAAGILAVLTRGPGPAHSGVASGGAVVTASLGIVLVMSWLDATAVLDSTRRRTQPHVGRTLDDQFELRAAYGPYLWLVLAAVACALAGTVLLVRQALRRPSELPC